MPHELRKTFAGLLQGVADGQVTPQQALDAMPENQLVQDKLVSQAWHVLKHFVDDDDIRSREVEYDLARRRELVALAERLLKD